MADATEVPTADETKKSTRREVSRRFFLNSEGEPTKRATNKTTGFRIEFAGSDEVIEHQLSDFDEGVRNAAAAFGMVTSITNTFGGNKGPVEDSVTAARERVDVFLEGDWSGEAETGPRSSQILEAAVQVRSDAGQESSDAWKEKFLAGIKADPELLKKLNKDPAFSAKLQAIKLKAAQERLEVAQKKAKEAGTSILLQG